MRRTARTATTTPTTSSSRCKAPRASCACRLPHVRRLGGAGCAWLKFYDTHRVLPGAALMRSNAADAATRSGTPAAGPGRPRLKTEDSRSDAKLCGMSARGQSLSMFVVQRSFSRVRRGYDPDEVDRHLELVSRWFTSTDAGQAFTHERAQLQRRERAVASTEADMARVIEGARLEAEATLDGARRRADADQRAAERTLAERTRASGRDPFRRRSAANGDARPGAHRRRGRRRSSARHASTPARSSPRRTPRPNESTPQPAMPASDS